MKIKKVLVSFCLLLCLFFLCSCGGNQTPNNIIENSLSEYRKNLFVYKNNNYLVTLTSGERESNYIMDGVKSDLVDFGVVTVKFNDIFAGSKLQFELKIDNDTYSGEFERNPYDNTFVFDIGKQVKDESTVSLYFVDFDENVDMKCISKDWEYDHLDALEIFAEAHKEEIKTLTNDNSINGEIYIKTVTENNDLSNIYWYVLLVCKNGEMYANLISVTTGQIVQTN